jgi:C_GCAxxG_C_C family probable redox protein
MTNAEKAIETFDNGFNCAQAVISAYIERFKLNPDTALQITSGFGAGIAHMQETCGAVSGSIMLIGLYIAEKTTDISERKEKTQETASSFIQQFKERNGTLRCRELLNCDVNTEEGMYYYDVNELHDKVCMKCVKDAVEILDKIFKKNN